MGPLNCRAGTGLNSINKPIKNPTPGKERLLILKGLTKSVLRQVANQGTRDLNEFNYFWKNLGENYF